MPGTKRQTISFVSTNSSETFTPKEAYFAKIYRFKAVRSLVFNPCLRVNAINNVLLVKRLKENEGQPVVIKIPVGDYNSLGLENAINSVIQDFTDLHFEFDRQNGCFVFFSDQSEKYKILNKTAELLGFPEGEATITRTLGFAHDQEMFVQEKKSLVPPLSYARNLYSSFVRLHDDIEFAQIEKWNALLPSMYREIGPEINICLNNFACVRSYNSEAKLSRVRAIAKLSLGAPGLPSKRLISSEMGARLPFDESVCVRYLYDNGAPLDDSFGLSASLELLAFHK